MLRTFISLAIFIIAACAHGDSAYTTTGGKYPAYACNLQINIDVLFCNKTFDYACLCQNENALATYAGCLSYMDRINHDTLHRMDELCERGEIVLEPNWIEGALERFKKYAKSADEIEGFNTSIPIDVPFKLNETAMKLYDRSYATFLHNYDHSLYYGTSTLMYWLLIILIGAVTNWSKFLFPGSQRNLLVLLSTFGESMSQFLQHLEERRLKSNHSGRSLTVYYHLVLNLLSFFFSMSLWL